MFCKKNKKKFNLIGHRFDGDDWCDRQLPVRVISDQTLSKVEFHSTPARARKDRLAELYLRVNVDREVCCLYCHHNDLFRDSFTSFSTYSVAARQHVMSRNFQLVASKPLSLKANNKKKKERKEKKGPEWQSSRSDFEHSLLSK